MKLPNGESAVIEPGKLRDYCLSALHPRGRHKARVFFSVLGLSDRDVEVVLAALAEAARNSDAQAGLTDAWGARYTIDFELAHAGRSAQVRSAWILLTGEHRPRFTSCYVLLR